MNFSIKKQIIFGVIIINLLGAWSFYYMFYGKEKSFDRAKKVNIDSSKINKIETDNGVWNWGDKEYNFNTDFKVLLEDNNDIISFCRIMQKSNAKYIDTRASYYIDIYLNEVDLDAEIKLYKTMANEIYFEFENHTYEGTELSNFLKKRIVSK